MSRKELSDSVLIIMKNLNLVIILYIAAIIAYSLQGYVQEGASLEFLSSINRIPMTAWKLPVMMICLYGSILLLMYINHINGAVLLVKVCMEIAISLFISYILGFSYTGLILLILADTIRHFLKSKWQYAFAVLVCCFYLMIDFELFSLYLDIVPLETYLQYFQSDVRLILLGIRNILSSLNTFGFLIYMILLMSMQTKEQQRILTLNEELNAANIELQRVTVQLEEYARESEKIAQTRERNRLAREIHDTLGHALTGIITGIEACVVLMDEAPEATKMQLTAIAEVARQGVKDVRRSVSALRPDALEKFDLEDALLRTVTEMRSATNVQIDYECSAKLDNFSEDEEDIIYRIVQESITNSIRHGKAEHIWIRIGREYNLLKIYIRDNGTGCKDVKKGFGLHHMEERLNMLNGSLFYDGTEGFIIEAQIPIRWGKGGDSDD
ncbi:MAG: sensor histidine kinase [Eubacteriales bacterium]|nr:sensor histidine kinase [Eubacteriales bacterium]